MAEPAGIETLLTEAAEDPTLQAALVEWLKWLRDERRSSPHTIHAYGRDLVSFLTFTSAHLGAAPTLRDLENLEAQDFRAWLARRAAAGLGRTSTARAFSVLRGFFRWLEKNGRKEKRGRREASERYDSDGLLDGL